jgi:hypothetical protein
LIKAPTEGAAGDSIIFETSEEAEATAEVALAATDETVARTLYGVAIGISYWMNRWIAA